MKRSATVLCVCVVFAVSVNAVAQDWPQWRGPHRDGKVTSFKVPSTWPKELTKKWQVTVGDGVSTPALVGDKLYVHARQGNNEVVLCLNAATGKELWQDKYEAAEVSGPDRGYGGPRSSPAAADGKLVTLGVQGTLSCYDADSGKLLWRNEDLKGSVPQFHTSSSPMIIDGVCIAQLGGDRDGGIIAFDLVSGKEKWKWTGDGPAYASPMTVDVNGTQAILAVTAKNIVAVSASDGKSLMQVAYKQGRYNATTPIVDGQTIIYAAPDRGITAERVSKQGDKLASESLWTNADNSVLYNTPVLKDGLLFGISTTNSVFCINAKDGKTAWTSPLSESPAAVQSPTQGAKGGGGQRGGRGGGGGYGSLVDVGSKLLALTPASDLIVVEPNGQEFRKLASYKVATTPTHAHPIAVGNRVYVKDQDSVILWTFE